MSAPKPQPSIMGIDPYVGGEAEIPGSDRVIKLASNEGAFGPSPKAIEAFKELAGTLHRYPDGSCGELRRAIGERHGLDPEHIVCGAGSDELIGLLSQSYAGSGDEVLHSHHGFLMYPISAMATGATPVAAPETNLTADVDALLDHVTQRTRILFVANPNNPTGTYLSDAEMRRLRAGLRDDILLVVDAAYADYVERDDYQAGDELVHSGDNVVMTQTFSKIHGMGGLRLGWAYCPAAVANVLNRVRGPFNVNAAAAAAGIVAIGDTEFTERVRLHNKEWRAWTCDELVKLGLSVTDSVGNFLLVCFGDVPGRNAEAADTFLKERGIIVRRMTAYHLSQCLRITIGLEDEMRAVIGALAAFLGRNK